MKRAETAATKRANSTNLVIHKMMNPKKKKGRPSLADLRDRQLKSLTFTPSPSPVSDYSIPSRRSSRRRISGNDDFISSEFISDEYDDDEDERKKKKVKLVVRLPQSNQLHSGNSSSRNSGSAYDSEPEAGEDHDALLQEGTINGFESRSNDAVIDQGGQDFKVTGTLHGSPLDCGPTTPLPDKKLLVFILDRLQKKDTYGVFAEPVDPVELPDYHEIIELPMDFGTVRKKLNNGAYSNLEELEADVILICSNAMQYNAPDTVYYRQALTIHELAKRDFANLRHEGEPKIVRRGRPPKKNITQSIESSPADRTEFKNVKKVMDRTPVDRTHIQLSSGTTLASGDDKANGSNGYNLRKGSTPMYRFHSNDVYATNHSSRNGDNYSDWLVDWNSEFPAKILRADMKYGKKHIVVDENKRDTYKQYQDSASCTEQPYLFNTSGDRKQLIPVGLQMESHGYARSLARFAANLGPVAWKVASMRIRSVLPEGTPFGPGWVGEDDGPTTQSSSSSFACEKQKPTNPNPPGLVPDEAIIKKPSFQNKLVSSEHDYQGQKKSVLQLINRNGMYQHDPLSQTGILSIPPDLNVRAPPSVSSPSSSGLQIGSPQQPDLALQL